MTRLLLGVLLFAVPACGGHVVFAAADGGESANANSGSSSDDAGGSGQSTGRPGSPFPVCPGSQPKAGWPCPTPHQGCVYVNLQANTCESLTCSASYHWESSTPAGC